MGAGALVYGIIRDAEKNKKRVQGELAGLAEKLGGRVRRGGLGSMPGLDLRSETGRLEVRFVNTDGDESRPATTVVVSTPRKLPSLALATQGERPRWLERLGGRDIEVGDRRFDDSFLVRAEEEGIARTVLVPKTRAALLRLLWRADGGAIEVSVDDDGKGTGSVLRIQFDRWILGPEQLEGVIEEARAAASALLCGWDGPWTDAAERWGLGELRTDGRGLRSLVGVVGGLSVEAREIRDDGETSTVVTVDAPVPQALRVVHRDVAKRQGWEALRDPLGNPVLDMLVAVRCSDPDEARALFADEELTARLLEVVHAHPGSQLNEQGVWLLVRGQPLEGPGESLGLALALARALRDGVARLG